MLKGAQKRMVMLRTADSSLFETAYFILRDDTGTPCERQHDTVLAEANRILNQSFTPRSEAKDKRKGWQRLWRQLPGFLVGLLLGGAIVGVVWLMGMA